jgi:hypothetical protein
MHDGVSPTTEKWRPPLSGAAGRAIAKADAICQVHGLRMPQRACLVGNTNAAFAIRVGWWRNQRRRTEYDASAPPWPAGLSTRLMGGQYSPARTAWLTAASMGRLPGSLARLPRWFVAHVDGKCIQQGGAEATLDRSILRIALMDLVLTSRTRHQPANGGNAKRPRESHGRRERTNEGRA